MSKSDKKDLDKIKEYAIPIGAGLLGAVGAYALARSPIWGTSHPFFKGLRKAFGNKASVIYPDTVKSLSPAKEKMLSGYDKVLFKNVNDTVDVPVKSHGLTFDLRDFPAKSNASSTPTALNTAFDTAPGTIMQSFHSIDPKLIPDTKVLKNLPTEFLSNPTPEAFKSFLNKSLDPTHRSGTVLKIETFASKIEKPFKVEEVLKDPTTFLNKYLEEVKRSGRPLGVYTQKEIPGEVYRATIIENTVVPGSVVKRYGIKENILDRIVPSRRAARAEVEKTLDTAIQSETGIIKILKQTPFYKDNIPMYNPDFIVTKSPSGKIIDLKIVDFNTGAAGNIAAAVNPPGNWALTRALTGKQPKVLAATGAVGAGTASGVGATFIRKKNKEA